MLFYIQKIVYNDQYLIFFIIVITMAASSSLTDPTPIRYFYLKVDPEISKFSLRLPETIDLSDGVKRYAALLKCSLSQRIQNAPMDADLSITFWNANNISDRLNITETGLEVPFPRGVYTDQKSILIGLNASFKMIPPNFLSTGASAAPLPSIRTQDAEAVATDDGETIGIMMKPFLIMEFSPDLEKFLDLRPRARENLLGVELIGPRRSPKIDPLNKERFVPISDNHFDLTALFPTQYYLMCPQLLTSTPIYTPRPQGSSPVLAMILSSGVEPGSVINYEPIHPIWMPISPHCRLSGELTIDMLDAEKNDLMHLKNAFGYLLIAISTQPSL